MIEPPEVDVGLDANYDEEERLRQEQEEAARLRALRQIQAGEAGRGDELGGGSVRDRLAGPTSYIDSARSAAPSEVAPSPMQAMRPTQAESASAPTPRPAAFSTPATATPAAKPEAANSAAMRSPLLGGAGSSSPGTDKDLERAMGERDSRRTRNSVIDAIGLLLGGGNRRVTDAIGGPGNSNQPLEDLAMRRSEEERRNAAGAARFERTRTLDRERAEESRTAERRDPNSAVSRSMQEAIGRMNIGVTAEQLRGISAEDLEKNGVIGALTLRRAHTTGTLENTRANIAGRREDQDDQQEFLANEHALDREVRLRVAEMRRRRGGTGGGGGISPADVRRVYIETLVDNGTPQETAEQRASVLGPREMRQFINAEGAREGTNVAREQRAASEAEDRSQIAGWHRSEGAPRIEPSEAVKLRDAVAKTAEIRRLSETLARIHSQVSAAQRAGARADVLSPLMSSAAQNHELLISALREMGNYGVPQAAELARMERLAPRLESMAGWLSAGNIYAALPNTVSNGLATRLESYGYERGAAPAAGASNGDTVRVRRRRGGGEWSGVSRPMPRANVDAMRAAGWEVEVVGG